MGNEESLPSDGSYSPTSDWQSLYSYGSRAGRRSSLGSVRIPSPMEPPEPDLSHLSPAEIAQIRSVIGRAKEMKDEENKRIRKLEEEYVSYAADVERRATEVRAISPEIKKESPLCPICLKSELKIQEGKMKDGQNVCVDCGNLICLNCGSMQASVTSKDLEFVCHMCYKRRQLVLSSGLWHPGCDVGEDIPLAREIEDRLDELEKMSAARGPLTRSASLEGDSSHLMPPSRFKPIQRQISLPDYQLSASFGPGPGLEIIQETGLSGGDSPDHSQKAESPESDEMKRSTTSVGGNSLKGMGQPSSRSESEYSGGQSDIDMEDVSMLRSATDIISPDDGSDDYSFMSIGSSDDNSGLPHVRRKHRPKSLNLSRSHSATSSEDETTDSAISTDVESKYNANMPPDPHELRIALAASAFVEDMRVVDMANDTDDEVAEISAREDSGENKIRFSPSAPISPSWREGFESPPFSPRRRDSYPGKRRGSSPVSPKDKHFIYSDMSPPSRQLSLEELYDKESHASASNHGNHDPSVVPFAQRPSPKSPDEIKDSIFSTSGEIFSFDKPTSSLKKSKPFYSLDTAQNDPSDTSTVMDLATYAATIASSTANLTSMTVSPTNLEEINDEEDQRFPSESRDSGSSSPSSPGIYDNASYPDEKQEISDDDLELADPSQKSIDYQGSKRQKARPPTTDWSPVIDLSPILDVSPSLEEAEQAEMLAQQQEERQRQASREETDDPVDETKFAHANQAEVDYLYYGLKRYDRVEDISELVKQSNGTFSPEQLSVGSGSVTSPENKDITPVNGNGETNDMVDTGLVCVSVAPTNAAPVVSSSSAKCLYSTANTDSAKSSKGETSKQTVKPKIKPDVETCVETKKDTKTDGSIPKKNVNIYPENMNVNKPPVNRKPLEENKELSNDSELSESKTKRQQRETRKTEEVIQINQPKNVRQKDKVDQHEMYANEGHKIEKENEAHHFSGKGKTRRKLPQPTPEIMATQKQPIPKPRRKEKQSDSIPAKPNKFPKTDTQEPARAAPTFKPVVTNKQDSPKTQLQKQESDERRRRAKDMKAKPDPLIITHLAIEDASASPQYRVLESPPSPEQKAFIKREYSDSASSVSPSSSPDRELYLYPSPVTPPDSDSSPPKPHSPSSGTDFDDEIAFVESPKMKPVDTKPHVAHHYNTHDTAVRGETSKAKTFEKDNKASSTASTKSKHSNSHSKDQKQKDMKKVRRKLPPIPAEEDPSLHKNRTKPAIPRKPQTKPDNKNVAKRPPGSSTSDESSMNEDDKEVANIIRKRYINDLDKPSLDKKNGNYLQPDSSSRSSSNGGYKSDEYLKANIPPDIEAVTVVLTNDNEVGNVGKYKNETDQIIDALINIYGAPITQAMKGLKRRLQDEIRRVTEGRRRKIDEIEEIRVLKMQIGELKLGADKTRSPGKGSMGSGGNGKKRSPSNSRSSPQVLPRRARHKRQSSDPMVAKFSPIKEDKDIEAEMQGRQSDDSRGCKTADDSSQSGVSDNESIRSEPVLSSSSRYRKLKPSEYTKMCYAKQAQSKERLDSKDRGKYSTLISSQSEGNLPLNAEDEELRMREEKRRELQFEIEKRKRQIAEKTAILKDVRQQAGPNKQLTQSCDELSRKSMMVPSNLPPRPIPTGIIKPIDDETNYADDYKAHYQNQTNYSSTEYLAHKQEELMKQRFDDLGAYSSPFLYSGDIGEKSAFVPQKRTIVDAHSYSTGNVNLGAQDINISGSVTLPEIHTVRSNLDVNRNQCFTPDMEVSPPQDITPAMPLLSDVTAKSRKILHEIGTGSRPVSAEFNLGVDELMNGMYRVESDNSVDADEPIMKHMTEGGITILKQLERRKQTPQLPNKPKKYPFSTKRILLTVDPKDRSSKGRQGNGLGMKIVGGKLAPGCKDVGAYVATIFKDGAADQLHGELQEGDQVLEWNGTELTGKSFEEVQQIIAQPNGEIELVVRPLGISDRVFGETTVQAASCHSSYDNLDSEEESGDRQNKSHQGVDPKQLAAQLEGIKEAESPCVSHSSSQQDYQNLSASSACSSPRSEPRSEPTSTSSDQRHNMASEARFLAKPEQRLSSKKTSAPQVPVIYENIKPVMPTKKIWDIKQVSTKSERQMGDIQIQLNHDEMDHILNVHIVQARNLLPKDFNGLSDPFVKIYLLPGRCVDNKRRTKHIPRTLNPEWNETVTFPNVHREELRNKTLEITVWDYDRFKTNDFLGEVVLDLSESAFLDNYPHWYPLSDHDESTGVDLPRPTVLPPKSRDPETDSDMSSSIKIPRTHSKDRADKNTQSGGGRRGMGRRRRSLGNLIDTDRLQTQQPTHSASARSSPVPQK